MLGPMIIIIGGQAVTLTLIRFNVKIGTNVSAGIALPLIQVSVPPEVLEEGGIFSLNGR